MDGCNETKLRAGTDRVTEDTESLKAAKRNSFRCASDWPTHSDGLAGEQWEKEVEHSARVSKRMLAFLTT